MLYAPQNRPSNFVVRKEIAFGPSGNLGVMTKARLLIFGIGLAFFAAACAKGTPSGGTTGTGGTPGGGTGGIVGPTCSGTQTPCGTNCVDTSSDTDNCGVCGNACTGGQTCQDSQCKCPSGMLSCSGACVA